MPSVVPGWYYREKMAPVRGGTYVRSLGCWVCSNGAMRRSLCVSPWFVRGEFLLLPSTTSRLLAAGLKLQTLSKTQFLFFVDLITSRYFVIVT